MSIFLYENLFFPENHNLYATKIINFLKNQRKQLRISWKSMISYDFGWIPYKNIIFHRLWHITTLLGLNKLWFWIKHEWKHTFPHPCPHLAMSPLGNARKSIEHEPTKANREISPNASVATWPPLLPATTHHGVILHQPRGRKSI